MNWGALYANFCTPRSARAGGPEIAKPFEFPAEAFAAIANPSEADLRWLAEALHDEERFRFVLWLFECSDSLGDAIFTVLLDAGIDEPDPSGNRLFIEPCIQAFGHRRVNEHLLEVLASGSDRRKAGAANAMYWAGQVEISIVDVETGSVMPGSRIVPEGMSDVWERQRNLLLETFVSNPNLEVRRCILGILVLDPTSYPESHRPLITQAIAIARNSEDAYLRHRVEIQIRTPREGE